MNTVPGFPVSGPPTGQPTKGRFLSWPITPLGKWSLRLAAIFAVLWIINMVVFTFVPETGIEPWRQVVLPFYAIFMLACGLAAGVLGLLAVVRQRERSWLVWLAMFFGLFVLVFLLGEVITPH